MEGRKNTSDTNTLKEDYLGKVEIQLNSSEL